MLKEYQIPPWEWDEDYPEEMYGHMFPEDSNTLVQIDIAIDRHRRVSNNSSNGIG